MPASSPSAARTATVRRRRHARSDNRRVVLSKPSIRTTRRQRGGLMGRVEPFARDVEIVTAELRLPGHLVVPPGAGGVVVFAHGSGSARHSPRNTFVASVLNGATLGTLLLD